MALSDETKQLFLDALARTGIVADALRESGIKTYATISKWRREDEQFSAAYDEALDFAADALEAEARRRAIEGVRRTRYDKDGKLIAEEQVYSDTLLIHLLKANKPEKFAERTKSEITSPDGSFKPDNGTESAARIAALLDEARRRREAGDPLFE